MQCVMDGTSFHLVWCGVMVCFVCVLHAFRLAIHKRRRSERKGLVGPHPAARGTADSIR